MIDIFYFISRPRVSALIESDELVLPVRLVDIWRPLLQLFHESHATPLLLQRLLQQQSEAGGVQDRLLAGWVATIVTAINEGWFMIHACFMMMFNDSCALPLIVNSGSF